MTAERPIISDLALELYESPLSLFNNYDYFYDGLITGKDFTDTLRNQLQNLRHKQHLLVEIGDGSTPFKDDGEEGIGRPHISWREGDGGWLTINLHQRLEREGEYRTYVSAEISYDPNGSVVINAKYDKTMPNWSVVDELKVDVHDDEISYEFESHSKESGEINPQ